MKIRLIRVPPRPIAWSISSAPQGLHSPRTAFQHLANQGQLVVAAFENPDRRHPGHLAIVRPAVLSQQHLHDYGPQIIQAGQHNYRSASLAKGFEPYPLAWGDRYVRFFAHPVAWKP